MKCLPYLIAILACLGVLMISLLMAVMIKNRKKICRWWKRHAIWMFIVNVFAPFAIPLIMTVVLELSQEPTACGCADGGIHGNYTSYFLWAMTVLALINLIFQLILWIKEKKDADIRWENSAARSAYNNMFKILMDKNTRLRGAYHHGLKHGMLTDSDIPYNVFSQIRTICWEFCNTISEITHIEKKDLSAAFVYRYAYKDATDKDKSWRWITGKGSKFNTPLTDFTELPGSSFRYLIHNSISTLFYNDKQEAANKGQYMFSYRDDSHKRIGSFLAAKVAFSGNDDVCCEGIIMVHSYGHKFLDKIPRATEEEFEKLIFDSIFPCYRHMLQTELAMLYFRHDTEEEDKKEDGKKKKDEPKTDQTVVEETIYCIKDINKKEWRRVRRKKRIPHPDEILTEPLPEDDSDE